MNLAHSLFNLRPIKVGRTGWAPKDTCVKVVELPGQEYPGRPYKVIWQVDDNQPVNI